MMPNPCLRLISCLIKAGYLLVATLTLALIPFCLSVPWIAIANSSFQSQSEPNPQQLEVGKPIERELAGGGSHSYRIALAKDQFLHLAVEQRGIDVTLRLLDAAGKEIAEVNTINGTQGMESIKFVANAAGDYRLEVKATEERANAATYQLKLIELRNAMEADRARTEALILMAEALGSRGKGKIDDVITSAAKALAIQEKLADADETDLANSLNTLGSLYQDKGDFTRAEPFFQRAVALWEKSLGAEHLNVAVALNNLASLYHIKRDFARAEPLFQRALAIREKSLGPSHPDVALILNNLAVLNHMKASFPQAEQFYQRALEIREKTLAPDHADLGQSYSNLATLYRDKGDYARAEPLFKRALGLREKSLGPDHPNVATTLNALAVLYQAKGDYDQAEAFYRRALALREKSLGPDHPNLASPLGNLATLYHNKGDYLSAEPLHQRSLAIQEKAFGQNHPSVAITINNLAALYRDKGDYEKAAMMFQRALEIREKTLPANHPDLALGIGNLATLYRDKGDYARAEPLFLRALSIYEKTLGPDHPDLATTLNNLAAVYRDKGDYAKADSIFQRSLSIREKTFGPNHPDVAWSLSNLAGVYQKNGDYERAEKVYLRALAIWEKVLGPDHPNVNQSLNNLALIYRATGERAKALTFQSRASETGEINLRRNLAAGSERQKLAYLTLFSAETNRTLSLHAQFAPDDSQALNLALTTLLRRKGRMQEVMADTVGVLRRRAAPQDQQLFSELTGARAQLASLTLRGPEAAKPEAYRERLKQLEDQVERLETELSARSLEFRVQSQPVTIEAVRAAIPKESALVEFGLYKPFDAKTNQVSPVRYVAYALAPQGPPRWVDLGEAQLIDDAVLALRKAVRDPTSANVRQLARNVDQKVMQPVRKLIGAAHKVLLSPDGMLNLLPFAVLVDERNRFLVETYSFTYLTSGRDLLRLQVPRAGKSEPLILANPAFGLIANIQQTDVQAVDARTDFSRRYFRTLGETLLEANELKALLPLATVLTGTQATETALKQAGAPRVLHIATHGFFLQDAENPVEKTRGFDTTRFSDLRSTSWAAQIENPLLRSGLALAGVNEHHSSDDDGVLTAMEAASLDLWGTKLVVLSACDTGVGEVKNGEGVYGLRRALVLAGSETQVMSLWPVSDKETRGLMVGYYKRLLKGEGRGEALRQVQLMMLKNVKLRHPHYWASFIQAGEWANLEGNR